MKQSLNLANKVENLKTNALKHFHHNELNQSISYYEKALKLAPNDIDILNNLGSLYGMTGRNQKAQPFFLKLYQLLPNDVDVISNLATNHQQLGNFEQAEHCYQNALKIDPSSLDTRYNLAVCYSKMGYLHNSLEQLNIILNKEPTNLSFKFLEAEIHYKTGNIDKTKTILEYLISKQSIPNCGLILYGKILIQTDKFDDGIFYFFKGLEAEPTEKNYIDIGYFLQWNKLYPISIQILDRATKKYPNNAEITFALAESYRLNNQFKNAINKYEETTRINKYYLPAHNLKLFTKLSICDWNNHNKAMADFSSLCTKNSKQCQGIIEPFSVLSYPIPHHDYTKIAKKKANEFIYNPFPKKKRRPGKPRVGYISPDFNRHSIGLLIPEVLKHHNTQDIDIYAYYTNTFQDTFTKKIERIIKKFKFLPNYHPRQVAQIINDDDIDILIDLAGYTGKDSCDILKYQPARIQTHYLGYSASMQAPFIQSFITDEVLNPPECSLSFNEDIWYLPNSSFSISSLDETRCLYSRKDYNLPDNGFIYCCLCAPYRIEPEIFGAWMTILLKTDNSYLWLYAADPIIIENLHAEANKFGIPKERIVFNNSYILTEQWQHQLADVWLDTHLVSSGTASLLSLQVNLPILTILGKTPQSRTSAAINIHHGIPELSVTSIDEYIDTAIKLKEDSEFYKDIKHRIFQNKQNSSVFAPKELCADIEQLLISKIE